MELLQVKTTLPTIEANFDVVKQQLIDGLKTYDVIITAETVKDGKAMASEINKIKKAIKDQEKKALEDILGPGNEFKEKIKELMDLAEEAREKITTQVTAYEEKTKLEIQNKIVAFTNEEVAKAELREPFIKIEVLDLVKLTAQTKTGNLTSATINMIKGRVSEQKNLQLEEDAKIAQEKKEEEEKIAKIKEDARIEAEANIKVHVTVDPKPFNQHSHSDAGMIPHTPEEAEATSRQVSMQPPAEFHNPGDEFPEPHMNYSEHPQRYQEPTPEEYASAGVGEDDYIPNHDLTTGEVYDDVPAYMEQPREEIQLEVKSGTVIITAEFEVDISSIPNITDDQLVNAIQKRLRAADVNNSTIVAIQRF